MSRISDLAGFTTALSTTEDLSVGVITASSFSGNLTGNVTGNVTGNADTATNATGLSGSPNITVGTITAGGNVSIAGTLTYQDVTNVDAVGMVTARKGIQVLADGINVVGVVTATSFAGNVTGNLTGDVNAATFDTGVGGVVVTGVATATSFSGNLTGNATGLSGTPDITVNNVVAGVVTATSFEGSGGGLTGLNIPAGFTELDAALFN
jgi:hypothetical protein